MKPSKQVPILPSKRKYYFAYGSNLDVEQMKLRCPGAKAVGQVDLIDHELVFKVHADVVECKGSSVPGAIYSITARDEQNLDLYEGYPAYYTKGKFTVQLPHEGSEAKVVEVMFYSMRRWRSGAPTRAYYNTILRGYKDWDIPTKGLREALEEALKTTPMVRPIPKAEPAPLRTAQEISEQLGHTDPNWLANLATRIRVSDR